MPDVYPGNLVSDIRDLRERVESLEALLSARQPITAASKGWLMSEMAIPSVSAGQVQIGCNDGRFFARDADGIRRIPAQGGEVIEPNVSIDSAPGDYDSGWGQSVADGVESVYLSLLELLSELRNIELIE
jgi:hypothetical protein